jgi:hypothetical protein
VLEDRQLVGVIAHVVEQPLHQARGHRHRLAAGRRAHRHRPHDGLAALAAAHAGDEVLAVVDRFGQIPKLGAIPQKVGAHGQHHVNRGCPAAGRLQQQVDKGRGLLAPAHTLKAEQLLKLVHHQQQVLIGRQPLLLHHVDQPQPTAAQAGGQQRLADGRLFGVDLHFHRSQRLRGQQGLGQSLDGLAAGPHGGDAPAGAGPAPNAAVQGGQQPGPHQRRFAAAGDADHRQKAGAGQPTQQLIDLALAAKKAVGIGPGKGAQAGKGVVGVVGVAGHTGLSGWSVVKSPGQQQSEGRSV